MTLWRRSRVFHGEQWGRLARNHQNKLWITVPSRLGSRNKRSVDFDAKYDALVEKYGDPLDVLFSMANNTLGDIENSVRATAAKEVIKYRWAQKKSIEHSGELGVIGNWTDTLRSFDEAESAQQTLEFPEDE